jgi:hypothetical protein
MVKKATVPAHGRSTNLKARQGHGGPRNFTKGSVDSDMLSDSLKTYVAQVGCKAAFDFEEYNSTWSNCAVRGKALAKAYEFAMALLECDDKATVVYVDLKQALVNTLLAIPEAKIDKNDPISDQAGRIARRAIVIQNHLRKMCVGLEAPSVYQKCLEEVAHHPGLCDRLKEMHDICTNAWTASSASSVPSPTDDKSIISFFKGTSDMDDDDDFDLDLKFLSKLQGKGPADVDALADTSGAHAAKKPSASDSVIKKRPAKSDLPGEGSPRDEDPVIDVGSVKLEGPFPNGKCYIRHVQGGKKKSLVNLDKSDACKDNGGIMKKVLKYIKENPGCRKSEAIVEKNRLMKK